MKNILIRVVMEYTEEKQIKDFVKYNDNHFEVTLTNRTTLKDISFNSLANKKGLILMNKNFEIIENKKIDDTGVKKIFISDEKEFIKFIKGEVKELTKITKGNAL